MKGDERKDVFFCEKCLRTLKSARRKTQNVSKKKKNIPFGRIIPPFFFESSESDRFFSIVYMIRIRFFGPRELIQIYFSHGTLYSLLFTLYSLLFTLYSLLFTLYSLLFTLYSLLFSPFCPFCPFFAPFAPFAPCSLPFPCALLPFCHSALLPFYLLLPLETPTDLCFFTCLPFFTLFHLFTLPTPFYLPFTPSFSCCPFFFSQKNLRLLMFSSIFSTFYFIYVLCFMNHFSKKKQTNIFLILQLENFRNFCYLLSISVGRLVRVHV